MWIVKLFLIASHCAKWFLYLSFSSNWIVAVDGWWLLLHFKPFTSTWASVLRLFYFFPGETQGKTFLISMKKSFVDFNAVLNRILLIQFEKNCFEVFPVFTSYPNEELLITDCKRWFIHKFLFGVFHNFALIFARVERIFRRFSLHEMEYEACERKVLRFLQLLILRNRRI